MRPQGTCREETHTLQWLATTLQRFQNPGRLVPTEFLECKYVVQRETTHAHALSSGRCLLSIHARPPDVSIADHGVTPQCRCQSQLTLANFEGSTSEP
jgi:hypothetical protein